MNPIESLKTDRARNVAMARLKLANSAAADMVRMSIMMAGGSKREVLHTLNELQDFAKIAAIVFAAQS